MELIDFFDRGARMSPDRPCFVTPTVSLSYGDVRRKSILIASALQRDRCAPGTHFAVLGDDDPSLLVCALGGVRAHLVWLPVVADVPHEENVDLLDRLDCDVIFYKKRYAPVVSALKKRRSGVQLAICVDDPCDDGLPLEEWIKGAAETFEMPPADPSDVIAIIPTGGTTGTPKGAVHTHLNFQLRVASHLAILPVDGHPKYLLGSPLNYLCAIHCFQMFVRSGTGYLLPRSSDPREVAAMIERHGLTDVTLPVTHIYMILADSEARRRDFGSLQNLIYSTAPMSEAKLRDTISVFGPVVCQVYSQTETLAHITHLTAGEHFHGGDIADDQRLRSCGRPGPMVNVGVMDHDGRLLGPNQRGELVVRGNSMMKGYYGDDAATAEVSRYGWHHTGDAGYSDDSGFFHITDRVADLIPSAGALVSPSEIERCLMTHPSVRDCAIIGLPTRESTQRIIGVVELKEDARTTPEELSALCSARLGSDKTPAVIDIWSGLPRSPRGKVLKREIRQQLLHEES